MVETRTDKAKRILRATLDLGDDSPIERALTRARLMDTSAWQGLTEDAIDSLTFENNGVIEEVVIGDTIRFKAFICMVECRRNQPSIVLNFDGSSITPDEFEQFFGSNEFRRIRISGIAVSASTPPWWIYDVYG